MTWKTVKKNNNCLFPRNPRSIAYFLEILSSTSFSQFSSLFDQGRTERVKSRGGNSRREDSWEETIAKESRGESGGREEWAEDKMG